jgi:MtN3 and saliva related transmembrane protein
MLNADLIGYLAAGISVFGFVPQVVHCAKTKRTKDVSLLSLIILLVSSVLWFLYGVTTQAMPVMLTNGIIGCLVLSLMVMKSKWG